MKIALIVEGCERYTLVKSKRKWRNNSIRQMICLGMVLLCCVMPISGFTQTIQSGILQIKQDRIYFDSGIEAGIFLGSPFDVICGDDTALNGRIEYTGPGISYSRAMAGIDTALITTDCTARITVADVDSGAIILLGTDLPQRLIDPEHETLFARDGDTIQPVLLDSIIIAGNRADLYLRRDVRFADGSRFDAEAVAWCFNDLRTYGQSYLTRYFFSKLLAGDAGIEILDGFTVRLNLYHPLPRMAWFFSHPDFAIYNIRRSGTGALASMYDPFLDKDQRAFAPNRYYRGDKPRLAKLVVTFYDQSYRMRYAFEQGKLDGYIGFGFDDILAGTYDARASYPETAVMIAGLGGSMFSSARLPTSLYYRFNPDLAHLYYPPGEVVPVNSWLTDDKSFRAERPYYPYDDHKGRQLQQSISQPAERITVTYDNELLSETARYVADIAAREGLGADVRKREANYPFDIRIAFVPASDSILPLALLTSVLEVNDQDAHLPADRRLNRPGWSAADRGSQLYQIKNRNTFFRQAEDVLVNECGCFPLFRPHIFAVTAQDVKHLSFDFYGYPVLKNIIKFTASSGEK